MPDPDEVRADVAWPVATAKAKFSELIDTVEREGPQVISKHGREIAVVVPIDEWRRKTRRSGTLAEFLARSPLRESDLSIERVRLGARDVEW